MVRYEEETPRETPSARSPVASSFPPSAPERSDRDVLLGQLLAATARQERAVNSLTTELGVLRRELTQHSKTLEDDQRERLSTAKHASKLTSERMAALLGTLFVLWQEASPVVHEVVRMIWASMVHK